MQKINRSGKIKKAFSLIEISFVIVIIGILITGITGGAHLVRMSRISSARAVTLASQLTTIPGLVVWFESTTKESLKPSQTVDGAQVDAWYNREPSTFLLKNNLSATASADVLYKDKSINYIPALNMTVAGKMSLSNFVGSALDKSTVVLVFRPTIAPTATATTIFDSGATGNATVSIGIKNDRVELNAGATVETSSTTNAANFYQGVAYILVVYFNGASSKVYANNIYEIGSTVSNCALSANATISPGANYLDGITVGADKSGSNGIAAEIPEVIVFNRVLKDSERLDLMSYLSKKYKITVTCM